MQLARRIAVEAGDVVHEGRRAWRVGGGVMSTVAKSSPTDIVTEFDRASERMIVERLHQCRPNDSIVGEEGASTTGSSGITWLIDPIDGTTNFLYDLGGWAVSVAAHDAEGPLAAAVYAPTSGELFSAVRGGGATRNDVPIRCGHLDDLSTALVATGFSYSPQRRREQAARLTLMMPHIRDIRRLGAASVDLCNVAMGRIDVYFEEGLGPWDLAAGHLVASEAGCVVGDFTGGPARPEQVLVANPALFRAAAELIASASR